MYLRPCAPLADRTAAVDTLPGDGDRFGGGRGHDGTYSAPTLRGSFEQIDRQAVRDATEQWQAKALAPGEQSGHDTEILASLAEIDRPSGQDAQLTLLLALGDGDGLDPAALSRFAEDLSNAVVFSPIIQPQVTIAMNDAFTGALIHEASAPPSTTSTGVSIRACQTPTVRSLT